MMTKHDTQHTDFEIHDYLDNVMGRQERIAFEARLKADPSLRKKLDGYRAQIEAVRRAYDPIMDEDVPQRLLAVLQDRPAPAFRPVYALAASVVIALCLGSAYGGWKVGQGQVSGTNLPIATAEAPQDNVHAATETVSANAPNRMNAVSPRIEQAVTMEQQAPAAPSFDLFEPAPMIQPAVEVLEPFQMR